jgi:Rieske Fe-S protein
MTEKVEDVKTTRRGFFVSLMMWGSMAVSYGLALVYGLRFLYPRQRQPKFKEIFVATTEEVPEGGSFEFTDPVGSKVLINRIKEGKFAAFSDVCPHLGCKVHWMSKEKKFFCPCHAGEFNENGIAIAGPPKEENKNLKSYELIAYGKSVFIRIPEV